MTGLTTDQKLSGIFQKLQYQPDFPANLIKTKVAIFSTPRCGSSLFCNALKNTGQFGFPKEWLSIRHINAYRSALGIQKLNLSDYLDFIYRKTTTPNGLFSINIHIEQYVDLIKNLNFDPLNIGFDRIYFLKRRNKIAQAVSLTKAGLSDQWTADTEQVREIPDTLPNTSILNSLMHISASEEFYEANIKQHVWREYTYEDFRNIEDTTIFNEVLLDCGQNTHHEPFKSTLRKQAGGKSADHIRAFKAYLDC